MSLHPDVIDAMVEAGCTPAMIAAVYRAWWSASEESRDSSMSRDIAPASRDKVSSATIKMAEQLQRAEAKRKRDRENLRRKRAEQAAQRTAESRDSRQMSHDMSHDSRDSSSLSLSESLISKEDSDLEREDARESHDMSPESRDSLRAKLPARGAGRMPLPRDWQPNDKGWRRAVERLSEIGAANLLVKFREYFEDDPHLRTAGQWQMKFFDWVEGQKPVPASPLLPFAVSVPPATGPPRASVMIRQYSPQAKAWEKFRGKPIPWGNSGVWAVESEWPPSERAVAS